jgi:hypothetical protein
VRFASTLCCLCFENILFLDSSDDVFDFLGAIGNAHDIQALVIMLCVLMSCPLPCGIPLSMLLETMHHIYSPSSTEQASPSRQSPANSPATGVNSAAATTLSSPTQADICTSPPLLKRSVDSPYNRAAPVLRDASLQDVSQTLSFDVDSTFPLASESVSQQHRSVQFLVIAACIKSILAVTFVAASPSLSIASAHVREYSSGTLTVGF